MRGWQRAGVNLGNPAEQSVQDSAEDVIEATGSSSRITHVGRPVDDPQVRCPDITRATQVLGWSPRTPWTEGLARTVSWWRERARGRAALAGH